MFIITKRLLDGWGDGIGNKHQWRKVTPNVKKNKGPDNPTSQLLPKMSFNGFSGDREGRKDKGGGERSCMYVCMYVCM